MLTCSVPNYHSFIIIIIIIIIIIFVFLFFFIIVFLFFFIIVFLFLPLLLFLSLTLSSSSSFLSRRFPPLQRHPRACAGERAAMCAQALLLLALGAAAALAQEPAVHPRFFSSGTFVLPFLFFFFFFFFLLRSCSFLSPFILLPPPFFFFFFFPFFLPSWVPADDSDFQRVYLMNLTDQNVVITDNGNLSRIVNSEFNLVINSSATTDTFPYSQAPFVLGELPLSEVNKGLAIGFGASNDFLEVRLADGKDIGVARFNHQVIIIKKEKRMNE